MPGSVPPLPIDDALPVLCAALEAHSNAVLVAREGRPVGVVTRSDLLEYLAHQR